MNRWKDGMNQIFTGRLFQSEGALNIKAFLAIDLETAGTEKRAVQRFSVDNSRRKLPSTVLVVWVIEMYTFFKINCCQCRCLLMLGEGKSRV